MDISLYPKYLFRSLIMAGRDSFFSEGYRLLYPECTRRGMTPWQHYVLDGRRKGFGKGNNPPDAVFFPEGYYLEYPDVLAAGIDAWRHFAKDGIREGRDNGCHPDEKLFFAAGYLAMYPDVAKSGMDPWHHYVLFGKNEGRDNGLNPNDGQFFARGYLEMYPDVAKAGVDPWKHYVLYGKKEGRDCGLHPKYGQFFAEGYLEMYRYAAEVGVDPWRHYVLYGKKEGRDNGCHPEFSRFFPGGYSEMYPDVARAGIDPWKHYVLYGKKEGRDSGHHPKERTFFAGGYREMYPDVARAGIDPWKHYVLYGKKEGRDNGNHPNDSQFFARGYLEMYPDIARAGADPWRHYVINGKKEGRDNGNHPKDELFFADGYLAMYPDVAKAGVNPWHHYVLSGKKEGRDNGHHPKEGQFFAEGYKRNYPSWQKEPYGSDPWMNYVKVGKQAKRNNGLLPAVPFFNGGYIERHPGCTAAEAWKDYVQNEVKNPDIDMNLYPEGSGIREILRRKNPSVAVVMPVYNRKNIVMQAIDSVLGQSWRNWHLYVVDDFSDDGTWEYLKSAVSDPRITLLRSRNKGVCGARNTAIAKIKNEDYVAYLDSDNTWNREYLELMLCRLLETGTYCCYAAQKRFQREKDGSVRVLGYLYQPFDVYKLREFNFIDMNVLMHRACVFKETGDFDASIRRMVDWDLILGLAERYSFSRLPYVGCNYDSTEDETRITQKDSFTHYYLNVVRNKHWLDWDFLAANPDRKDKSLVSVIVYYGKNDAASFLRNCLASLKNAREYGQSEYRTEIILVDDTCSEDGHAAVSEFYDESLIDKYIVSRTECSFPLGCNRALSLAEGFFTVFLDSQSYVSINWLDPLVDPLKRHPGLMGTTSKVLQPDGVINSIGCLFDTVSGLPYDLLHDLPSGFPVADRITLLPCVNSYCSAFRTSDVIGRKGLYCIYASAFAIHDICLQLGGGRASFAYIPSSAVICPADAHPLSSQAYDVEAFAERWFGTSGVYSEELYFKRRGLGGYIKSRENVRSVHFKKYTRTSSAKCSTDYQVPVYDFTKLGYGCEISREMQGVLGKIKSFTSLVVIKDPAPGKPYDRKYEWGDYYYARSLARSFEKLGFDTRIDSRDEWYSHDDGSCINIVLRGPAKYDCKMTPDSCNVLWIISCPRLIDVGELNDYDCVFAASQTLAEKYSGNESVNVPCSYLPQCTDPDIFSPVKGNDAYSAGNLLLGNSRGVLRDSVRLCIEEGVSVEVIGNHWEKFIKPELVRSGAVPNLLVPSFYSNAEAILNDHYYDQLQDGIVSNRIFDALACGRGIVTDNFKYIPEELQFACFSYEDCGIKEAIERCRQFNHNIRGKRARDLRKLICDRHSFSRRALQIIEAVFPIIERGSHI